MELTAQGKPDRWAWDFAQGQRERRYASGKDIKHREISMLHLLLGSALIMSREIMFKYLV